MSCPLVRLGEVCSVGCHGVHDKKLAFNIAGIRCFFVYPSSNDRQNQGESRSEYRVGA